VNLGENVRRALAEKNLDRAQLAQRWGVGRSAVHQLVHGEANPRLSTLERIAASFGMSVSELLREQSGPLTPIPGRRRRRPRRRRSASKRRRAS
jgi:transcriptional regulator with XRE-family HTH domain